VAALETRLRARAPYSLALSARMRSDPTRRYRDGMPTVETEAAAARLEPGLVGDLGLLKLCSELLGPPAAQEDRRTLLERYGEWAGLASVYPLAA
jgi:hypothetical protein